ncbi:apolipoprotein N-acyltransferase [Gallalistipes aquisgranensis]|uniref:apolipoprotein N-acyltransferase n=1 Tax=Gallalistipes aquisgranensis TaxID=2779358 RepID=UPI001CF8A3DB|nr:apolipoprotein N-acyltransferase [Gallalistipes aquisgranensis]MBE5034588.1 apolipoprotein N-acyltransferase [Gallalistipes aquisgranensis]
MRKHLLLSLLSALMLSAGWLSLSGIPLLGALVPLLLIADDYGTGRRPFWKLAGWTALTLGLWSAATTWWIWYAAAIGAVLSVLITAGLMGGLFMLWHGISLRAGRPLSCTVLVSGWIACEYLYTVGQVSFPWLTLGNGFACDPWLVQWYEYTGVFGGSLWVLVANLCLYRAVKAPRQFRRWIAPAAVILLPALFSVVRYLTYDPGNGPEATVTVVQPNIDPYNEKFDVAQADQTALLIRLAEEAPADVDYIVMPETAIDDHLWEGALEYSASVEALRNAVRTRCPQARIIAGATTFRRYEALEPHPATARTNDNINYWYDVYNSAMEVDTSRRVEIHHKSKLVVGVEKMPYYEVLKHLEFLIVDLGGISGQLGTDSVRKVFVRPDGLKAGAAICFESVYGEYMTEFVRGGAGLLFVITNDGWWGDTPGHRQHFSFSRLRAIETRRSIARSANTGISGFITPRGDVVGTLGWDRRGTLTERLRTNDMITFYTRYGDYIGRLSSYVFLLSLLYFVAYRTRRRNHLVP